MSGYSGVAIASYAALLIALGMIDKHRELAEASSDKVGLALEEEHLPERIEIRPRPTSDGGAVHLGEVGQGQDRRLRVRSEFRPIGNRRLPRLLNRG